MNNITKQSGFSIVELLITLFIAGAFLISGYQLYALVIKDGGDARVQSNAASVANDYLQRYKPSATNPCTAQTPLTNQSISVTGLSNVTMTVAITCPYTAITAVSKIAATINYNTPQKTITSATYVKP